MERPKAKVCRNLFGAPTAEESERMRNIFKDCILEEKMKAKAKYNFDIDEDQPLAGPYEWIAETNCPSFYTKGYAPHKCKSRSIQICRKRKLSFTSDSDSDGETQCNTDIKCEGDIHENDSGFLSQENSLIEEPSSSSKRQKKLVQTRLSSILPTKKKGGISAASKSPRGLIRF